MNQCYLICAVVSALSASAADWHVAVTGDNRSAGSSAAPFRTIQRAADAARPGDVVTVHEGVYRERVNPPRGGVSDELRIVYQAAPGEKVVISGSEPVKGWVLVTNDTWTVTVPNALFGAFNPFSDLIRGDWFNPKGRQHHTGAVYLNGHWLTEAAERGGALAPAGETPLWHAQVEADATQLFAQFKGCNPNREQVEINVRQTVFYPDSPGRNFITVRGFVLRNAATPWAPPTAEQIGLIGTHWSKGWVIEGNDVAYSACAGISLGKHGDRFDNTSADTAEGYVKTIERAHAHAIAWTRENIGHHVVRSNRVSHCEQAGIVGSLGCAFSTVTGNDIHDIHVRKLFSGAEMAGIKFHAAIDGEISGNHIYRTCRGLWLDWMAQGTRVTRNLFHDNAGEDVFVEVNHGPFLFDNNLLLSRVCLLDWSEGGAYAHNLMAGKIISRPELKRETPFHPAHATAVAGLSVIKGGDNRFFNNIFIGAEKGDGYGLCVYNAREYPLLTGGNVYLNNARPHTNEIGQTVFEGTGTHATIEPRGEGVFLRLSPSPALSEAQTRLVSTESLGKARIPQVRYERPDGSPLAVDGDYFGKRRDAGRPTPGPFEAAGNSDSLTDHRETQGSPNCSSAAVSAERRRVSGDTAPELQSQRIAGAPDAAGEVRIKVW